VRANQVGPIKTLVRNVSTVELRALAEIAMKADNSAAVRRLAADVLQKEG